MYTYTYLYRLSLLYSTYHTDIVVFDSLGFFSIQWHGHGDSIDLHVCYRERIWKGLPVEATVKDDY